MRLPWFPSWLSRHIDRHELLGLPEPDKNPDMYEGWASEFGRLRIGEEQAETASRKLLSRQQTRQNHFNKLIGIALDKPPPNGSPLKLFQCDGPDYEKPETLTREQRLDRIRLIRSELPTIELNAATFPEQSYQVAVHAAKTELAALLEIENEYRRSRNGHAGRGTFSPAPY